MSEFTFGFLLGAGLFCWKAILDIQSLKASAEEAFEAHRKARGIAEQRIAELERSMSKSNNSHPDPRAAWIILRMVNTNGTHIYEGSCPDDVEGRESRDPQCNECFALTQAEKWLRENGFAKSVDGVSNENLAGKEGANP